MFDKERESFFESLITAKKWKYSEEEQRIMFDKFPHKISAIKLLERAIMKFKTRPSGQELKDFAWKLMDENKVIISQQTLKGCNNCVNGYIKVPNLKPYMKSEESAAKIPPDNLINLFNVTYFPSREIYCNCTKTNPNIIQYLIKLMEIQYVDPKLYEFFYVTLYAYAKMWLGEKRFNDFDKFNPYEVWTVHYEQGANLKRKDLKYYGDLIDMEQAMRTKPKVKKIPAIIAEDTYKHKIY